MRKILAPVLLGVGAFLVVAAIVAQVWAPGQIERTPLDTDNTTYLSGSAQVAGGDDLSLQESPVLAFSVNQVDADASDDEVAAWTTSLCVVRDKGDVDGCVDADDAQGRLVSAETEVFATDRKTALTVDNGDYVPAGTPQQDGLQNKWPFGAEKKTYPVWDGMVGAAVDATYEGTEELDGLETYLYRAEASAEGIEVISGVTGSYLQTTDYYIEPRTGAIIKQVVHQERVADGVGEILDLDLAFTDDQVQANVDDAEENIASLRLLETIVPVVGYAAGVAALVVGFGLLLLRRRTPQPA
jgi:Porin PorA